MVAESLWNSFSQWVKSYFGWNVDPTTLLVSTAATFFVLVILFNILISRLATFREHSRILSLILTIAIIASSWYNKTILWFVNVLSAVSSIAVFGVSLLSLLLIALAIAFLFSFFKKHKSAGVIFLILLFVGLFFKFGWPPLVVALIIGILYLLVKKRKKIFKPKPALPPGGKPKPKPTPPPKEKPKPEEKRKLVELADRVHKIQVELIKRRNVVKPHAVKGELKLEELKEVYNYLSEEFYNPLVRIYYKSGFPFTKTVYKYLKYSLNNLSNFAKEAKKAEKAPLIDKKQRRGLWRYLSGAFYYLNEACTQMIREVHAKI